MDYIPQQPPAVKQPPTEYVLVDDVTHKAPVKRGPQVMPDSKGNNFEVPYAPNPKCKKCYGRAYIGYETKSQLVILCHKCYPPKK